MHLLFVFLTLLVLVIGGFLVLCYNWGSTVSTKKTTAYVSMLQEQNGTAEWFSVDIPRGEDHIKIMLNKSQAKQLSARSDSEPYCGSNL